MAGGRCESVAFNAELSEVEALVEAQVAYVGSRSCDEYRVGASRAVFVDGPVHEHAPDASSLVVLDYGHAFQLDLVSRIELNDLHVPDDRSEVMSDQDTAEMQVTVQLLGGVFGELEKATQFAARPRGPLEVNT
jgi:hypothetical protein